MKEGSKMLYMDYQWNFEQEKKHILILISKAIMPIMDRATHGLLISFYIYK